MLLVPVLQCPGLSRGTVVTLVKLEIFLESSFEGGAHTVVDGEVEGGVHHLHTAASYNVFIHPPHITWSSWIVDKTYKYHICRNPLFLFWHSRTERMVRASKMLVITLKGVTWFREEMKNTQYRTDEDRNNEQTDKVKLKGKFCVCVYCL